MARAQKPSQRTQRRSNAGDRTRTRGRFFNPHFFNGATLGRAAAAFAWLAVAALMAGGIWFGAPHLHAYAALPTVASDGAVRPHIMVVFRNLPEWMHGDELDRLVKLVQRSLAESPGSAACEQDPLDRESLTRVHTALLTTGWFDSLAQVRLAEIDRIEITGTFAQPAALVRREERGGSVDRLVDTQGRLLRPAWPAGQGPTLGVVVGVSRAQPATLGATWPGQDLQAALRVLALVDLQPWANQVQAIDVSAHASRGTLSILTDRGSTIRWGRGPGDERAAEVTSRAKLEFLTLHFGRYGHIDGGLEGEVDVSGDVAVVR